ncbi:hypothetical protein [Pseudoxanthomonas sp. 10H]|uniref:hypothetical protein n=1 Tax=Pseudoxanthomonas sp. 10H TaxID=3242729 RepID=UPI0035581EF9
MHGLTLPDLTPQNLDTVRLLAQEGCREHTIRRALGLTLPQWKALKEDTEAGELSPLALALEEGRAEGAGDIIACMKQRMREGSERAAEFLADRVFQLNRGDGNAEVPRVAIYIQAALSPTEYAQVIAVQQPGALTHER